jgi:hypothetical protein
MGHVTLTTVSAHRSLLPAVLMASLCAAGTSRAQHVDWRAVFAANLQGTDNLQFVPMNGPAKPIAGFTADLNPSVILSYEAPRWLHELQYTLNFAAVLGDGQQINYTNRLEARTRYEVSELTTATFALRFTQGQLTFFPTPLAGVPAAAWAPGTFVFVTGEVAQGVNTRLSERLAFTENLVVTLHKPVVAEPVRPEVLGAGLQMALQYTDDPDAFNVNFGSQFGATGEVDCVDGGCGPDRVCRVAPLPRRCVVPDTPPLTPTRRAEIEARANPPLLANRLGVGYRRDFNNGFNGNIDIGVQQAMRLSDGGGQNFQPVGRLALAFQEEGYAAQIGVNHGAQLAVELGGLVMATNVDLGGGFPLDRQTRNFNVQMQLGYQRGTPFDATYLILPGFHVAAFDTALVYRPEKWLPNLQMALRYSFRIQFTEDQAGGPVVEETLIAIRNGVMVNIGFEYPERKPAQ